MAKHLKLLGKLCATPTPSDIKWNELKRILEHLGYGALNNSGSRRKFFHKDKNALIICHAPHPSPDVDKACIADIVEHLCLARGKLSGLIAPSGRTAALQIACVRMTTRHNLRLALHPAGNNPIRTISPAQGIESHGFIQ